MAYNVIGYCEYLYSTEFYACSLYVHVNGSYVTGTNEWIGETPFLYWYSDRFFVEQGDTVTYYVWYSLQDYCIGFPLIEPSLTVADGRWMGKRVASNNGNQPIDFSLEQNFPNPFNPSTTIKYSIPRDEFVNLSVYNMLGEKVASIVHQQQLTGNYKVTFNASKLSSGMYIYVLNTKDFTSSKKLILMK